MEAVYEDRTIYARCRCGADVVSEYIYRFEREDGTISPISRGHFSCPECYRTWFAEV